MNRSTETKLMLRQVARCEASFANIIITSAIVGAFSFVRAGGGCNAGRPFIVVVVGHIRTDELFIQCQEVNRVDDPF